MRITLILAGLLIVCFLIAGCGGGGQTTSGKTSVVAAFYPLAYAAEQLGGKRVVVHNLTPAGAEPHDLELTPDDVKLIQGAGFVFVLGHGFQPAVEAAAKASPAKVISLLDTPGLHLNPNGDPHVWLDPLRYALIVRRIATALHADPAPFVAKLHALDRELRAGLAHCTRHDIVTSHAAFGYFAQRYGLHQVSIEGLSPEAEPSPRQLSRVAAIVRARHVTTIYFETLVSPKIAQTLARETGARTAVLDPLEGLTPTAIARGENYFTVMRRNLANLRAGLECR